MRYFFGYGEFPLRFAPVFFVIAFIFTVLVWNNSTSREKRKQMDDRETNDGGN
jgi:hypothetical protein